MENGKITTDELADMIKNGFDEVGTKLTKVEDRLAKVEQGQTDIKSRLDSAVYRFEFFELERRIEILEAKMRP